MRRTNRAVDTAPPTGPWPRRLGTLAGATAGLLVSFGLAALADKTRSGNPEWILRLGSPVAVLGGAAIGLRAGRGVSARGYRVLAAVTGLLLSATLALLLVAVFGLSR